MLSKQHECVPEIIVKFNLKETVLFNCSVFLQKLPRFGEERDPDVQDYNDQTRGILSGIPLLTDNSQTVIPRHSQMLTHQILVLIW